MTEVNIDIVNQGYESHPDDRVVIYSPANRNHAGQIISTAVKEIPLVDGKATEELAPGPVVVRLECMGVADIHEKSGYVPESGPVSLWDVILDWTPALVDQGILAILAALDGVIGDLENTRAEALLEVLRASALVGSVLTEHGTWTSDIQYPVGAVVEHQGKRWYASMRDVTISARENLVVDPKMRSLAGWSKYSNVTTTLGTDHMIVTLGSSRPGGNGILAQVPWIAVSPGDPVSAGLLVSNPGSTPVTVRLSLTTPDVFDTTTNINGPDVTIPAGQSARLTASGTVPSGKTSIKMELQAGDSGGGVAAGTILHVSQAIVEKASPVGPYFDGDSEWSSWSGTHNASTSVMQEHQETELPTGEPGISSSWILLSVSISGLAEAQAQLAHIDQVAGDVSGLAEVVQVWARQAQSSVSASTLAKSAAESASSVAVGAVGEVSSVLSEVQSQRQHVDAQAAAIDTAFTESVPPYLTKPTLDSSYASSSVVAGIEDRTRPQKMLFGLPVPKPHRAPNLAVMDSYPTPDLNFQILRAEGDTLWAYAMDKSLYKYTPSTGWVQKSYHAAGIQTRGGITRAQDGSLLLFSILFDLRRSTDEGATWTTVQSRRTPGLEPLTTQSIAVDESTGYIYYGEYTNGAPTWEDVALWRSTDHGATWEIFHTWPRPITGLDGSITHIHGVQYDPIGQDIYIMTGDGTASTGLWRVEGDTCIPVLTNGMLTSGWHDAPRAIGLMFFPDYVAWGSDSTSNPHIFRIPRSALGSDPSKLERGPRMSSTSWGTARASEDGSRWVMFSSDEAYPSHAADRMAHIYSVEDQGATVYEVGAISSQSTSGVTTLQPLGPAHHFRDHFWVGMRTGSSQYGAWKARLGYGGQTIPWPTRSFVPLMQSQSSGRVEVPPATSKTFGVTRAPVYATRLAVYESTILELTSGNSGNVSMEVVADGVVVYSSGRISNRHQSRAEHGGPLATIKLSGHQTVEFRVSNTHPGTPMTAVAAVTFAWVE